MKKDIVLVGVGGQGIITISIVIVDAAIGANLNFRQSEVHGMSQRGGAVESQVRINDGDIYGDLVAKGHADLLIAVEPLEALRKIDYVSPNGIVITSTNPFKNIPNYPDTKQIMEMLGNTKRKILTIDAEATAKEAGSLRAQNVVMVGAASKYLGLDSELLRNSVKKLFEKKGQKIVDINLKAFELGAKQLKPLEQ
ncbi:MAG TPA: indolepyruvate oxidoreductase subunit beta [Elusimicrobiales bacterium]|nr:indolepyruvate oxidoreductase subunit beta [Elusimicrobiales bacterium]